MKVLLVHPYITSEKNEFMQTLSEPLGLLSLATYMDERSRKRISISLLDLYALGHDRFVERADGMITRGMCDKREIAAHLKEIKPGVIGIHCTFTGYARDVIEIANICKEVFPEVPVVLGGAHASYDYENILSKHSCIDYIVRSEGEETFYELVEAIEAGNGAGHIKGLAFRVKDGKVTLNPDRDLIRDLNDIPIVDRAYIDMGTYKKLNHESFPVAMNYPVATIMASRGCPYNCIFCSTKNMWRKKWRGRHPSHIIREIEYLIINYGIKEIVFYDDQFLVDKKWVNDVCDAIISKNFKITLSLPSGISLWLADSNLLRKMKKAGFYRIHFPIESGNPETIKFIRKPINLENVLKVIKAANKMGFWTSANFIIGFPDETFEDINRTLKFAYECGIDYPVFIIAKPLAGAELYEIMKKNGFLRSFDTSSSLFVAKNDTRYFKADELVKIRNEAEQNYFKNKIRWYFNPYNFFFYFLPKIISLNGLKYSFKIISSIRKGKHKRVFEKRTEGSQ